MRSLLSAMVVSLVLVTAADAQTVIGTLDQWGVSGLYGSQQTYVDLSHPALGNYTVNTVALRWITNITAGCPSAVKIRFFRRGTAGLQAFADRGPFTAVNGMNTYTMTPPVSVTGGDLIGAAVVGPACGTFGVSYSNLESQILTFPGDVQVLTPSAVWSFGVSLDIAGSANPQVLSEVVPAVAATAGSNGSFFRTALQVVNGSEAASEEITLVFHPAGQVAAASDKKLGFILKPYQSISFDDVVTSLGASGLGSLDVMTTSSMAPLVVARVFNDGGSAGTSGFTEKGQLLSAALGPTAVRAIPVPTDLTKFRMNIGIRTLTKYQGFSTMGVVVTVIDPEGTTIGTVQKNYPENYFEQVPLSTFLNNLNCPPGSTLKIDYLGPLFIYGAVTDNKTNDGSIILAQD